MFRLFKLMFVLAGLAAMAWFGFTVKLGERTLFEHVRAIWKTPESQDLLRGTKEKVGSLVDRATDKATKGAAKNIAAGHGESGKDEPSARPMEEVPTKDRNALRGLIGHGLGKE